MNTPALCPAHVFAYPAGSSVRHEVYPIGNIAYPPAYSRDPSLELAHGAGISDFMGGVRVSPHAAGSRLDRAWRAGQATAGKGR